MRPPQPAGYSGGVDGVIIADKPEGMTSHDVVNRLRRLSNTRKVGHLGTLDPMATGVLPLVIGRATRLAQFFSTGEKKYQARIRFGWATDTYDREGIAISAAVEPRFTREELETELARRNITRIAEYAGERGVALAIEPHWGAAVERPGDALELLAAVNLPSLKINCDVCHPFALGYDLRSIAHEVGQRLGCGAFLDALRRTASGEFVEQDARTLTQLEHLAETARFSEALIPASQLLPQFPSASVDALTAGQIRQGRDFRLSPFNSRAGAKYVKAIGPEGELIAIGEARLPHLYHPILVL